MPAQKSIDEVVQSLTLEQKVRLLSGAASFATADDASVDLDAIILSDGPTGVRGDVVVGGRKSCLLPNASLLAQTWDVDLLEEVGDLLAEEAIAQQTHVVLGPTINLHRTPLGGRLFEAFSEDPFLTGRLAAAYVRGLQERGIGSSAKHFLANESETERTTVNAVISDEALREVYLKPFEIVVEDANPWTLMAAYNRVNGVPSTEQHELIEGVVKGEWRYDGLVMSDWFATSSTVESVTAGLDLVMPGPDTPWAASLVADVRRGAVDEAVVDAHVRRLLLLAERVGAFRERRSWATDLPAPDSVHRRQQMTRLAASGMVVLKNEGGVLPLDLASTERIAVIGRHAIDTIAQGGGSARVRPPHIVNIGDGIATELGRHRVHVVDGVETRTVLPTVDPTLITDPVTGEQGARVRVFADDATLLHERHLDVAELEDSKAGWLADAAKIEISAAIGLETESDVQLGARGAGRWHIQAPGHEEFTQIPFHNGPGGGFFRPKSHASTVRLRPGDVVTVTAERAEMPRILGMVVSTARRSPATAITAAAEAAQAADVAIVVVGNTPDQETEGQDKQTLTLPGHQDALVTAVASAARRTVVVVNAASPVLMPWSELVDAIIFVGLPGQEAGTAVAKALTGAIIPEGRLVTTFPAADGDGPAWSTQPDDGDLEYTDDRFVGYRGWLRGTEEPAFWFGHGLGYTTWEYQDFECTRWPDGLVSSASVEVTNTGRHAGVETVQVYLEPADPAHPTRLIGWERVHLEPGERARVIVECDPRMQRSWSRDGQEWQNLTEGTLQVARGLADVRATIRTTETRADEGAESDPTERIEA